jgi:hypothetical protein
MPRGPRSRAVELTSLEREELERLLRRRKTSRGLAMRAQIVLTDRRFHPAPSRASTLDLPSSRPAADLPR